MKTEKLTMRAVLPAIPVTNAINYGGKKETIRTYKAIGTYKGALKVVAEARLYMGRASSASTIYCALWVHSDNYTSGRGEAGGYGYHKGSAALQSAITSAGIELYGSAYSPERWDHVEQRARTDAELRKAARKMAKARACISGVGETAIETALKAIARAAGATGQIIIV